VELYDKLSIVYDLPVLGPSISLDYLKELLKPDCKFFKIERTKTRTLGISNVRKRFDAKTVLETLEKLLKRKHK